MQWIIINKIKNEFLLINCIIDYKLTIIFKNFCDSN